jgi:hypothetical protein
LPQAFFFAHFGDVGVKGSGCGRDPSDILRVFAHFGDVGISGGAIA